MAVTALLLPMNCFSSEQAATLPSLFTAEVRKGLETAP